MKPLPPLTADVAAAPASLRPGKWLNRNVLGMGLTSLLSDAGHESATAILPAFLSTIGASAIALGVIEGVADAVASFVKLGAGWYSDRVGQRKPITVAGYVLTGISTGLFAAAYRHKGLAENGFVVDVASQDEETCLVPESSQTEGGRFPVTVVEQER